MSEKNKILYNALWIAHPILQMGIAAMMYHQGLHRKFKFFFGYILIQLITFAVVFPTYWHNYSAAFYLYWGCDALSVAFGFAVIHEVFVDVFRAFPPLRDLAPVLFKGAASSCCWWPEWSRSPPTRPSSRLGCKPFLP